MPRLVNNTVCAVCVLHSVYFPPLPSDSDNTAADADNSAIISLSV